MSRDVIFLLDPFLHMYEIREYKWMTFTFLKVIGKISCLLYIIHVVIFMVEMVSVLFLTLK